VITIGRANSSGSDMRPSTCWNVDACPTKGTNCLGMLSRETGHSRVPTPPHMITGIICTGMALACSNTSSHPSAERQAASQRIFFGFGGFRIHGSDGASSRTSNSVILIEVRGQAVFDEFHYISIKLALF